MSPCGIVCVRTNSLINASVNSVFCWVDDKCNVTLNEVIIHIIMCCPQVKHQDSQQSCPRSRQSTVSLCSSRASWSASPALRFAGSWMGNTSPRTQQPTRQSTDVTARVLCRFSRRSKKTRESTHSRQLTISASHVPPLNSTLKVGMATPACLMCVCWFYKVFRRAYKVFFIQCSF